MTELNMAYSFDLIQPVIVALEVCGSPRGGQLPSWYGVVIFAPSEE